MIDSSSAVLAFMPGVFTLFSPCSFPLPPGYFGYRLTTSSSRKATIVAKLISVFSVLALLLSLTGPVLNTYVNMFPLIGGLIMAMMGILMLAGKEFSRSPFLCEVRQGE